VWGAPGHSSTCGEPQVAVLRVGSTRSQFYVWGAPGHSSTCGEPQVTVPAGCLLACFLGAPGSWALLITITLPGSLADQVPWVLGLLCAPGSVSFLLSKWHCSPWLAGPFLAPFGQLGFGRGASSLGPLGPSRNALKRETMRPLQTSYASRGQPSSAKGRSLV